MAELTLEDKAEKYQALQLECNLMIFNRYDCPCSTYWARNGQGLIEDILETAVSQKIDPLEYFTKYAADVHKRHADDGVLYT